MTVSAQTPVNSSTGNGVTTVFPYTFKIIAAADLEVTVDGVVKTLTTDYTVSGAGDDAGGNVTFITAPANGATVVRRRNMAFTRTVDYQVQGDLRSDVLNPDQDAAVLMAQQLSEGISRTLQYPVQDAGISNALPAKVARQGRVLGFNATTGAPEATTVTQTQLESAVAAAYLGGAASTLDALAFVQSGTGAVSRTAQAKMRDVVSVKDFGAVCDWNGSTGTDDTQAVQAAVTAAQTAGGGAIEIPGRCKITAPMVLSGAAPVWIVGKGWQTSEVYHAGTGNAFTIGNSGADQTADVRFKDLLITGTASAAHGIQALRMHNWRIEGCRIRNFGGDGINLQGCYATWVLNNYCNNNTGNGIAAVGIAAAGNDFVQIIGNRCLANGGKGIYLDNRLYGPAGQRVELNDIEGNAVGFQLDVGSVGNTEGLTFRGNYLENNTGYNASLGEDGGSSVLNSPWFESNACMFGSVSAAANAVRFGAAVRQLNLLANTFVTSDLVINTATTLGVVAGNKSNATVPGGFDQNGGMTLSQLRLLQPGGGAYSAISMQGGLINANYPMQTGGEFYPASAFDAAAQASTGIWAGTGAPNNSFGASGHIYIRGDTPATANQRIYIKNGGTWTGIL